MASTSSLSARLRLQVRGRPPAAAAAWLGRGPGGRPRRAQPAAALAEVASAGRDRERHGGRSRSEGGVDKKRRDQGGDDEAGLVLLGRPVEQLEALAEGRGEARYRGRQLHAAVLGGAASLAECSSLPGRFRDRLARDGVRIGRSKVFDAVEAKDGTTKLLLQLRDGRVVETVGIPLDQPADGSRKAKSRLTVCVSSQVGCAMRCTFCATGKGGFARNLEAHESESHAACRAGGGGLTEAKSWTRCSTSRRASTAGSPTWSCEFLCAG